MSTKIAIGFEQELPTMEAYQQLLQSTGDVSLTVAPYEIIAQSRHTVCAYDNDQLVGIGCIVNDGIISSIIDNPIIHPNYESKGIESIIMKLLSLECKAQQSVPVTAIRVVGSFTIA